MNEKMTERNNVRRTGPFFRQVFEIFELIKADENPPVFYDPSNVIRLIKWLYGLSNVAIVYIVISGIPRLSNSKQMVDYILASFPLISSMTWLFTIPVVIFGLALNYFLYVLGLRAIANVMGILMEMEYNSRK